MVLVGYSVGWLVGRLYSWLMSVGYLFGWLVGVGGLFSWLVSVGYLVGWLVGVGWLFSWLVGVGWLFSWCWLAIKLVGWQIAFEITLSSSSQHLGKRVVRGTPQYSSKLLPQCNPTSHQ